MAKIDEKRMANSLCPKMKLLAAMFQKCKGGLRCTSEK